MKYGLIFMLVMLVFTTHATSQEDSAIIVHKDERIDLLFKKQIATSSNGSNGNNGKTTSSYKVSGGQYVGKGYRIMVLNSNDREMVYKVKGQLLSHFPGHSVYMSYQAPFFRLKMGDFIKREDAENFTRRLSSIVPRGVFVVPDVVKVKLEDDQKIPKDN